MKSGGQRNHDLLMVGTKNCIIGIEAKVSEKFDNPFSIELRKQAKKKEKETEQAKNVEEATTDEDFAKFEAEYADELPFK